MDDLAWGTFDEGTCAECSALLEPVAGRKRERHDPQCMTGQLERIEDTAHRLRRCIAQGSAHPFGDVALLLVRRMRAASTQLESQLDRDGTL